MSQTLGVKDFTESSINTASAGIYNISEVAQLSPTRLKQYFERVGEG